MSLREYKIDKVHSSEVNEVAASYGLQKVDIANLLGVSEKTLYNLMKHELLDAERSDRFNFINKILESGKEAFGSERNFTEWMKKPQPTLEGYKPIDMLSSINGATRVYQLLGRIKHGITA